MTASDGIYRGDGPCMDCGGPNVAWFTDNVIWNHVLEPGSLDDPGGLLCITCFIERAERVLDPICWHLTPDWPWRRRDV